MVMFHGYVSLPEGKGTIKCVLVATLHPKFANLIVGDSPTQGLNKIASDRFFFLW